MGVNDGDALTRHADYDFAAEISELGQHHSVNLSPPVPGPKPEIMLTDLETARAYADALFLANQREGVDLALPYFRANYLYIQERLRHATVRKRADMPVLNEDDEAALSSYLGSPEAYDHCQSCVVDLTDMNPVQQQVYLDDSIRRLAEEGVRGGLHLIRGQHFWLDKDLDIIDGHHRWTSGCLIDPRMKSAAFKFNKTLAEVLALAREFSDRQGHVRNI